MNSEESVAYVNVRIRARKSRFLGPAGLERLCRAPSLAEMLSLLGQTVYGPHVAYALAMETRLDKAAELALSRAAETEFAEVRDFSAAEATPASYLFTRWDLENLKRLIRGLGAGQSPEDILESLDYCGYVPRPVWAELAGSLGVEQALGKVASMNLGFRSPRRTRTPLGFVLTAEVEDSLDGWFYGEAVGMTSRLAGRGGFWEPLINLIRFDVDVRNMDLALRLTALGEEVAPELLISGGRMDLSGAGRSRAREERLADAILTLLPRRGAEAAGLARAGRFERARRVLGREAWLWRAGFLKGDPLSAGLLIGYVWAKAAEIADIRRAVMTHALHLQAGEALEEMFLYH